MAREYTNKLLGMVEETLIESETLLLACLKYMSEDDVKDMMHINDFNLDEDDDE